MVRARLASVFLLGNTLRLLPPRGRSSPQSRGPPLSHRVIEERSTLFLKESAAPSQLLTMQLSHGIADQFQLVHAKAQLLNFQLTRFSQRPRKNADDRGFAGS
jgi:hypothetical protein